MRISVGKASIFAAAVLLATAIGLQLLYRLREVADPRPRARLQTRIPDQAADWRGVDEALGATETVNAATLKTLNLDDYVYRRFTKGQQSFTIYAAYWAAGRMPTRFVASHTPDRCWTENGMRCVGMSFGQRYALGEKALLPAEYRAFAAPGSAEKMHVAYWHTVAGRIYDYGGRFTAVPHPWLWWKDTLAQAAYGSSEQYFVRIASTTPFEVLWKEPGFQSVMSRVADLGLWSSPQSRGTANE
jgi:hypothetical protein